MAQSYDAIVIGGGHNGLVSAFYLAQAGKKVLVLERYHTVGGAAITEEIHPGFKLSIASYCCSLLRPEIIADMRLADYGFSLYTTSPSAFHPFPDGRYIFTYSDDHERTKAEIAKFSARDAQGYDEWEAFWERVCDVLEPLLLAPPPSLSALADLFEHQGLANDFRRLFYSTTTSLLGEFFETDEVAAAVVGESIIGTAAGPGTPGTPYIWLIHALGRACGQRGEWAMCAAAWARSPRPWPHPTAIWAWRSAPTPRSPPCWSSMARPPAWCWPTARRSARAPCSRTPTPSARS